MELLSIYEFAKLKTSNFTVEFPGDYFLPVSDCTGINQENQLVEPVFCTGVNAKPCVGALLPPVDENGVVLPAHRLSEFRKRPHFKGVCEECWLEATKIGCPCNTCLGNFVSRQCFGTTLYECPQFKEGMGRRVYQKKLNHNVCSTCSTKWSKLRSYKDAIKLVKDQDQKITGKILPKKNLESVPWRSGATGEVFTVHDVKTMDPDPFPRERDQRGMVTQEAFPICYPRTIPHPLFAGQTRRCICCSTTKSVEFPEIEKTGCHICNSCSRAISKKPTKSAPLAWYQNRTTRWPAGTDEVDLPPFASSYALPVDKPYKLVFIWSRVSPLGSAPPNHAHSGAFPSDYRGKRYKGMKRKVLEGSGETILVPDRYYKSGPSNTPLYGYPSAFGHPTWKNLVKDVNESLEIHPGVVANISINRMDDLGTVLYHLWDDLSHFKYPDRTYLVIRHVGTLENRYQSATISIQEFFVGMWQCGSLDANTPVELALKSIWDVLNAKRKGSNDERADIRFDPDADLFSSQPSTVYSSQPENFQAKADGTSVHRPPSMVTLNGKIKVPTKRIENKTVHRFPDQRNERTVTRTQFATPGPAESSSSKRKRPPSARANQFQTPE